jgi:hypothetical protein
MEFLFQKYNTKRAFTQEQEQRAPPYAWRASVWAVFQPSRLRIWQRTIVGFFDINPSILVLDR